VSILIRNIYRRSLKKESLNILTFALGDNILYIAMMAEVFPEHHFWCTITNTNHWIYNIIPLPDNLTIVNNNSFLLYNNFDLIICHERLQNFDSYKKLSYELHIPLICYEHSPPPSTMRKEDIVLTSKTHSIDLNVCINESLEDGWKLKFDHTIPYCIPLLDYSEDTPPKILIIGDFGKQDYHIFKTIIDNVKIPVEIVGNNPQLSEPPKSWEDFLNYFYTSTIFLTFNNPIINTIYLHYAMAAGHRILCSNESTLVKAILTQSNSGTICNNVGEMIREINDTTNEKEQRENSISYITKTNSREQFCQKWNEIFQEFKNKVYTR